MRFFPQRTRSDACAQKTILGKERAAMTEKPVILLNGPSAAGPFLPKTARGPS